ncbi:MAG: cupredoxin domain-containing protein, partial [Actinobacteria bacterium]|nr:cupredoxin domain-containing protein [Actinomycetota bacterium]
HLLRLLLVVGLGLVVVSCGGGSSSSSDVVMPAGAKWTKESGSAVGLQARDNDFVPQFIEIKKGTKVTFENAGQNRHNVLAADQGSFEDIQVDQFDPGMSASRTFDKAGTFGYYCSLHGTKNKGMYGAIKVDG